MSARALYGEDDYPVFQNRMYASAEEARACPRGTIRIVEDLATGLVHNAAFDPGIMVYDGEYQNEQAGSRSFRAHLDEVAGIVLGRMGRANLVEVGCGKGTFLEMLQAAGASVTGFDPAYEGDNPAIERRYFAAGAGLNSAAGAGFSGRGLILRHVLEHIPDPASFLAGLAAANDGRGLVYIEVPCFDWICRERAWFDIFYEHVNYFRLTDFDRMFGRVVERGRLFGGQYLYVVADLASVRRPTLDPADRVAFPDDFTAALARLAGEAADEGPAVVWGGASKGVIFALLRERAGRPVARVIDINPAKQGRYLAATGLRVQAPDEALADLAPGSRIYVMNPNYLAEIKEMSNNRFTCVEVAHG